MVEVIMMTEEDYVRGPGDEVLKKAYEDRKFNQKYSKQFFDLREKYEELRMESYRIQKEMEEIAEKTHGDSFHESIIAAKRLTFLFNIKDKDQWNKIKSALDECFS